MNEFEESDVIYLKSGGLAMTITEVGGDSVLCNGFARVMN